MVHALNSVSGQFFIYLFIYFFFFFAISVQFCLDTTQVLNYHNDPTSFDVQTYTNSTDPDQNAYNKLIYMLIKKLTSNA